MIATNNHLRTKVIHGANDDQFWLGGFSVGSVRSALVDAFNIPDAAVAFVNGLPVKYGHRLVGGETLEFCLGWGRKGAANDLPRLPLSQYGTIDITSGIPAGLVHVDMPRLGPTCNRLGVEYGKAVVDWTEFGRRGNKKRFPVFSGIVIRLRDQIRLLDAIAAKNAKRRTEAARLPVLAALFTLNRRAKRSRDLAQKYYRNRMHGFAGSMRKEKERIYDLKGQVLHYMVEAGLLVGGRFHRFGSGIWAEVLEGGGYTFHRPCPPPQDEDFTAELIESIEAKPKGTREPTLKVSYEVIEMFLESRERVEVYEWPRRR